MFRYERIAQYYETDQMGVIHHANYLHWMEEARIALLDACGMGFDAMEAAGLVSPVTAVQCEYRKPVHFKDAIVVEVRLRAYDGVRLTLDYKVLNGDQEAFAATSSHVMMTKTGTFARMRRDHPEWDAKLRGMVEA